MNVLVIGSGGREHALVWKIKQSPLVEKLYCAPGNPGIERLCEIVSISSADIYGLARFAETNRVDLTIVGPEQPLAEGIVDLFEDSGLKIFGPTKRAAELEWSKAFAKAFMDRHSIPTARHQTFGIRERVMAAKALESWKYPLVLKADGLAAGKGVVICQNHDSALKALREMFDDQQFGSAGQTVVMEEFMVGEEASVFAICDGTDYVVLGSAQDHKRAFDNDEGKNTGGMGAYAPALVVGPEILKTVEQRIIEPVLRGMTEEGRPYKGCLYVGLMITSEGPKVVEFNSRFGDPETQVIMPLYAADIVELMSSACEQTIASFRSDTGVNHKGSAVCVVIASGGYPDKYETGKEICGLDNLSDMDGVVVFHAGTKLQNGKLATAGGRVLGVTAFSQSAGIEKTIEAAYQGVKRIQFDGMHFRHDIGRKALIARDTF